MIIDSSAVGSSRFLGIQFGTSHGLAVPVAGAVQGNLDTFSTAYIGWILEARVEIDIRYDIFSAVLRILILLSGKVQVKLSQCSIDMVQSDHSKTNCQGPCWSSGR
jgi:hypothetical protein